MSRPFSLSKPEDLSSKSEAFQFCESWKKDLNLHLSQSDKFSQKTQEVVLNLYKNETRVMNTVSTLQNVCDHHNKMDQILTRIIERQNQVVEELDKIEEKMIEIKVLEGNGPVESSEEIYEKYKKIELNKREIDALMVNLSNIFNSKQSFSGVNLDAQVEYLNYLQSNLVEII
jgi:hypothetical protein